MKPDNFATDTHCMSFTKYPGAEESNNSSAPCNLDPDVWGPVYWFFLHTIAYSYPEHVSQVTKRKYYDFIQNLPLFIPVSEMGNKFASILDKYPVSPYLDNRESFIRWVNFIHNKYNVILGKKEITLQESIEVFLEKFRSKPLRITENVYYKIFGFFDIRWRHLIYLGLILILLCLIYVFYK